MCGGKGGWEGGRIYNWAQQSSIILLFTLATKFSRTIIMRDVIIYGEVLNKHAKNMKVEIRLIECSSRVNCFMVLKYT